MCEHWSHGRPYTPRSTFEVAQCNGSQQRRKLPGVTLDWDNWGASCMTGSVSHITLTSEQLQSYWLGCKAEFWLEVEINETSCKLTVSSRTIIETDTPGVLVGAEGDIFRPCPSTAGPPPSVLGIGSSGRITYARPIRSRLEVRDIISIQFLQPFLNLIRVCNKIRLGSMRFADRFAGTTY